MQLVQGEAEHTPDHGRHDTRGMQYQQPSGMATPVERGDGGGPSRTRRAARGGEDPNPMHALDHSDEVTDLIRAHSVTTREM